MNPDRTKELIIIDDIGESAALRSMALEAILKNPGFTIGEIQAPRTMTERAEVKALNDKNQVKLKDGRVVQLSPEDFQQLKRAWWHHQHSGNRQGPRRGPKLLCIEGEPLGLRYKSPDPDADPLGGAVVRKIKADGRLILDGLWGIALEAGMTVTAFHALVPAAPAQDFTVTAVNAGKLRLKVKL